MTFLRTPQSFLNFLPFIILIGTTICLIRLGESGELTVIRAAGISAWQFLLPAVLISLISALIAITTLNPIAAYGITKLQKIEERLNNITSEFEVSQNGLWLREQYDDTQIILHVEKIIDQEKMTMSNATLLFYSKDGEFLYRVDAPRIRLISGHWQADEARITKTDTITHTQPVFRVKTQTSIENFQRQFSQAPTISIWELPQYIKAASASGIDVTSHLVRLHTHLVLPLLLVGMVLIAASFALPMDGGNASNARKIALAIFFGFFFFFSHTFIGKLSELNIFPIILAAWTPTLVVIFITLTLLLDTEGG